MTVAPTTILGSGMTDIELTVAESRAEQGLPPTLEDEAALDRIASLLVFGETSQKKRGAA